MQSQQAEAIRERTGYQVGHYCGEMGQDFWDARRWQREFETKQVAFEVSLARFVSFYDKFTYNRTLTSYFSRFICLLTGS